MHTEAATPIFEFMGWSVPRVKITGVRVHKLTATLKERFGYSLNWTNKRTGQLVEVLTDVGLSGWGDGFCDTGILTKCSELVIGRSPFEIEGIYQALRRPPAPQQRSGPPSAPGLDLALWDLVGKILDRPVCALFGQPYRNKIQPYVTALYRRDWPDLCEGLACEARDWKSAGYRAMKMKIGFSPELDIRIVAAVREAIGPEIALGVDSNCAYDSGTAIRLGVQLAQFDLMWWEEPLLADDVDGYRRLHEAIRIPLAAGETESAEWLALNYVQPHIIDVLQPDLENVGLTGARLLTEVCWLNHMRLVPHNWGTALRTAAALHWMSCCRQLTPALNPPPILFEFDQTEHPFRDAILKERIALDPADGTVAVPSGPGLGVTVIPEAVEEFRTDLTSI
jgi:D-galactarolactone cycloisomerase